MSQPKLDALERLYERWSQGDFSASVELFDRLALLVIGEGFPDTGPYLGLEGYRRYTRMFLEPWKRVTIEAEEMIPAGDSVVVAVRQAGAGMGSGATTEFRYVQVWTFRGDRVIRMETFRERSDALRAVGLPA